VRHYILRWSDQEPGTFDHEQERRALERVPLDFSLDDEILRNHDHALKEA
jgi:hypothetical protein